VQSVNRARRLIEALAEEGESHRLTDLAIRTGLAPSTVHRLLTTKEKRRFVHFDGRTTSRTTTRQIGAKSCLVGSAFMRRTEVSAI